MDTLAIAQDLRAADLSQPQAEAIARAIGHTVSEEVATKSDLELAVGQLKAEIVKTQSQLLTWFIGTQIAVGALIVAIIKL